MRGFPPFPQSSRTPAWRHCDAASLWTGVQGRSRGSDCANCSQKRKTRPGGQPDGSSHMGAWGGWALAPNTASMGRDNRSHTHLSLRGGQTFKPSCDFFNFFGGGFFAENYCAPARLTSPEADFSDAIAAAGWLKSRATGASSRSGTFSAAGRSETAATGTAEPTDMTAA
jgi:hypothetical protein